MRTAQDLLAERRALVLEQSHAGDPTEHAMLQFEIDQIDSQLSMRSALAASDDDRPEPYDIETCGVFSVDRDLGPREA